MHFSMNSAMVMEEYSFLSIILSSSGITGPVMGTWAGAIGEQTDIRKQREIINLPIGFL